MSPNHSKRGVQKPLVVTSPAWATALRSQEWQRACLPYRPCFWLSALPLTDSQGMGDRGICPWFHPTMDGAAPPTFPSLLHRKSVNDPKGYCRVSWDPQTHTHTHTHARTHMHTHTSTHFPT
jgi:hypothetical protein